MKWVSNHKPHSYLLNRYSSEDQRKHKSSAPLTFVRGIHRTPVNSPQKWPVTWKMFPFDDVIMTNIVSYQFLPQTPTKCPHHFMCSNITPLYMVIFDVGVYSILIYITNCTLFQIMECRFFLMFFSWWRYQMETFSALLALCAGNSPVTYEFPAQRPVTRSFDVFFDLRLAKQLSKQSRRRWFETPSRQLWLHCYVTIPTMMH